MIIVNCHTYENNGITVGMKIAFMTALLLVAVSLDAQDIHFSQFYMSPLNLNPAMTGAFNCDHRLTLNYRNQWAGVIGANAYNTGSASYDRSMPVGRNDFFGAGVSLYSDVAGSTRFGTTQAKVSFAYRKKIGGRRNVGHFLAIGAEGGVNQRKVQLGEAQWPSQVTNGQFDESAGTAEFVPNPDFLYADLSGGLMWYSTFGPRKFISGGIALHHLNRANVSFLERQESILSRTTIHIGGEYPLNSKISLRPDVIYMAQGPHKQVNAGTAIRFAMGPASRGSYQSEMAQSFQIGLWFRAGNKVPNGVHSDAIVITSRFEFDQGYSIGFSYDYNISQLSAAAAGNGSFELSFQYLICNGGSRGVLCPQF